MGQNLYRGMSLGMVLLYGASGLFGWEWTAPPRQHMPPSVRSAPHGFRTFHFWHSGFHGGK